MESLLNSKNYPKYIPAYQLLVDNSAEHQCIQDFVHATLSDILVSIGEGEPTLNVMGVGSGSGEIELEILKVLHEQHPDSKVVNEVVEPSIDMINKYKALLSKTPGLDYATYRWNQMTAAEFEAEWKRRNSTEKMHFINLVQMLYYVEDPWATISFYQSLLHKDGKVLVIVIRDESAWCRLAKVLQGQLYNDSLIITSRDVMNFLDSKKITYQHYKFQSLLDVTECFTPGDKKGELLLDALTEILEFSKTAPPELKGKFLEFLKHPDYSQEVNGRILFDCSTDAVLIDA